MKIIFKPVLTVCFLFIAFAFSSSFLSFAATIPKDGYQRIIVFGDSYSDNGNDFKLSNKKYPNPIRYFQGRFSNGPVWSEYLADRMGINPNDSTKFINLAYGQAKILSPTSITVTASGVTDKTYDIPSFSQEISMYVQKYQKIHSDDLVLIFISANDFYDLKDINDYHFFQKMADDETVQVRRLIKLGAKNIIVLNGRDVTYAPLTALFAKKSAPTSFLSTSQWVERFRALIEIYNQRLYENLSHMPEVFVYNTFGFDNTLLNRLAHSSFPYQLHSQAMVLRFSKGSCYQNNQGDYQGVAGAVCNNPNEYYFYDRIHTTSGVSYLLAEDVYTHYMTFKTAQGQEKHRNRSAPS